jgi:hypothetical protein
VTRPLSIKIAMALWILYAVLPIFGLGLSRHASPLTLFNFLFVFGRTGLDVLWIHLLWKMNRWSLIGWTTTVAVNVVLLYLGNPHWTDRYKHLGVFSAIIPVILFAALILPHWKKMSWHLQGGSPATAPVAPQDVF